MIQEMQLVFITARVCGERMTQQCGFLIDHMSSERSAAALKSEKKSFYILSFINHFFRDAKQKNSLSWTRGVYILLGSPLSLFFLPPSLHLPQPALPRSVEEDNPLERTRDLAADQSRKREILYREVWLPACVEQKRSHEQRNEENWGINRAATYHEHTWWR